MYFIKDVFWTKIASALSVVSGCTAGFCLILVSILDTYRYNDAHSVLLMLLFLGLALTAILTTFVYFDQMRKRSPYKRLRL